MDEMKSAKTLCRREVLYLGALCVVSNVLVLTSPLYMLQIYDRVLPSGELFALLMLSLIALFLFFLAGAVDALRGQLMAQLGTRLEVHYAAKVHMLALEEPMIPGRGNQEKFRDLDRISNFICSGKPMAFLDVPWTPVFIAGLFFIDSALGMLAIAGGIAIVVITAVGGRISAFHQSSNLPSRHAASVVLSDTFQARSSVLSMGMREALLQQWQNHRSEFLAGQLRAASHTAVISSTARTVRLALQSAALGMGAALVIAGKITPGMMIASSIILGRSLAPIDQIASTWRETTEALQAWHSLKSLFGGATEKPRTEVAGSPNTGLTCRIESIRSMASGGIAHPAATIAFDLKNGELLTILGSSGAGKSTLLQILSGTAQPVRGTISLGGIHHSQWGDRCDLIGYLPQNIELLAGSIRENIVRFQPPDPECLGQAIELTGLNDVLSSTPEGLDTQLGPSGTGLSAGQRQRVALARAVYKLPRLILLDEPNANLDDRGRAALLNCISKLKALGRIVVATTHSKSLLSISDKVMVLQDCRILHLGNARAIPAGDAEAKENTTVERSRTEQEGA